MGGLVGVGFGEFENLESVFGDGDSDFLKEMMVETRNVVGFEGISGKKEAVFVGVKWVEAGS